MDIYTLISVFLSSFIALMFLFSIFNKLIRINKTTRLILWTLFAAFVIYISRLFAKHLVDSINDLPYARSVFVYILFIFLPLFSSLSISLRITNK